MDTSVIEIPGRIVVKTGAGGLPLLHISSDHSSAAVYLYGAHVASFIPKGGKDLLWMSPYSQFAEGVPIRGGIPLCFPWFGPHPAHGANPVHGTVRLSMWNYEYGSVLDDGSVQVLLSTCENERSLEHWPQPFRLEYRITVGKELSLALTVVNTGSQAFTCSPCLHTYFAVSDAADIRLQGLAGAVYTDRVAQEFKAVQSGEIRPASCVNSWYPNAPDNVVLEDIGLHRKLLISKNGFSDTVVWNAWEPGALTIPDIKDSWRGYLCVESGNCLSNAIHLLPSTAFCASVNYSLASM